MQIYFTRHGESFNNIKNIIGGDSSLTEDGKRYRDMLEQYFRSTKNLTVWTSTLKRTIETSEKIDAPKQHLENLNEIDSGDFENFNLGVIKKEYNKHYIYRNQDKINRSYPNGESYTDLQKRVNKVLEKIDINQEGTLLIISHQAVSRLIYSFFTKKELDPNMKIELNMLYKFEKNDFKKIPFLYYKWQNL